jgi:hypothetical protein
VSIDHTFSSSRQELRGKQARTWTEAVQDLGLDLDPYDCKAAYVCGMLRQFIEAAGLQLASEYHVGALVSAASAAELLGRCYKRAGRLEDGAEYLLSVGPPYPEPVYEPAADLTAWVREVRNFGAHGAFQGKQLTLDRVLTLWLLRSLALALDTFWTDDGAEAVKPGETSFGYLVCMCASGVGWLIQATVGSFGGVGGRANRAGWAA